MVTITVTRLSDVAHGICAAAVAQPGRTTRLVDGGLTASRRAGRIGRLTSSPPQLGQMPCRTFAAQSWHQVHS